MNRNDLREVSRRRFIRGGFAGAGLLVAAGVAGAEGEVRVEKQKKRIRARVQVAPQRVVRMRRRLRVGLQLYSVRQDCARDLGAVLAAVGKMGYEGVEFAGYHGKSAKEIRAMLDANGLECCGTHTGMDTLLGDNLAATIEFNKILGNKYLIVPGLPGKYRESLQAWRETASLFNELAEKVKPHGMLVGYHNHSAEFKEIDGQRPWDVFCGNTSKAVVMQLDVGNAIHGGVDPLPYLYKYAGRARTIHAKEFSAKNPKALFGEGDVNWKACLALCRAVGGTEWFIIEQESYAYPPMECVKRCLENFKKIRV